MTLNLKGLMLKPFKVIYAKGLKNSYEIQHLTLPNYNITVKRTMVPCYKSYFRKGFGWLKYKILARIIFHSHVLWSQLSFWHVEDYITSLFIPT